MEDPARRRPLAEDTKALSLAEDTKALCVAITPGAEGLPSSVPDAHLPNARLPPCGGPSPPCACPRGLTPGPRVYTGRAALINNSRTDLH